MDLCKMFEFDCKVTQNISINNFLSLKISNFYILQLYSTKITAYLLPHCKITMGGRRKTAFRPVLCVFTNFNPLFPYLPSSPSFMASYSISISSCAMQFSTMGLSEYLSKSSRKLSCLILLALLIGLFEVYSSLIAFSLL